MLNKLKSMKDTYAILKAGNELLKQQNTDIADYDDQLLIRSDDLTWSFPFIARALKKGQDKIVVFRPQKKEVFSGLDGCHINKEYCEKEGIRITPFPIGGGAGVFDKGDVLIIAVYKSKQSADYLGFIRSKIVDFLNGKKINAVLEGNDILIDGNKVSGCTQSFRFGMIIEAIFISANNMQELMDKIGHKKPRKICGLKQFKIDIEPFVDWIVNETISFFESWRKSNIV